MSSSGLCPEFPPAGLRIIREVNQPRMAAKATPNTKRRRSTSTPMSEVTTSAGIEAERLKISNPVKGGLSSLLLTRRHNN
jgi:hypothetical protein